MTTKTRLSIASLMLVPLALVTGGCRSVDFYEKQAFSDPVMAFDDGTRETHFLQKVFYSMEGSAGGVGTSAGGGCGCY